MAELVALTQALLLVAGLRVTIYTDSKYAFLIAHSHAAIWKERGFLATQGTPTVNGKTIHHLTPGLTGTQGGGYCSLPGTPDRY